MHPDFADLGPHIVGNIIGDVSHCNFEIIGRKGLNFAGSALIILQTELHCDILVVGPYCVIKLQPTHAAMARHDRVLQYGAFDAINSGLRANTPDAGPLRAGKLLTC